MKKRQVTKMFIVVLAVFCMFALLPPMAQAAGSPVVTATLKAIPQVYTGLCPAVIKFQGVITVRNLRPGTVVEYQFVRSDGATGPIKKIAFQADYGTQAVETTWTLGGASLLHYEGWEAVRIKIPMWDPAWSLTSNKAGFKMDCKVLQRGIMVPGVPIQK